MVNWVAVLLEHWAKQAHLVVRRGALLDNINSRSSELGVLFPKPFIKLMSAADGFDSAGEQDDDGFSLWPLTHLELVTEYDKGVFIYDDCKNHVIFSDYLGSSWWYSVDCGADSDRFGSVFIMGLKDKQAKCIASDVPGFIKLYLGDDKSLYPP